ncbi:hypothetical protein EDB89DRAFT_1967259 [Lactarius sanguifluus]|nr:hypothetical protein EDB89DRAFT_1967259 [Lactarius sanguifluus]
MRRTQKTRKPFSLFPPKSTILSLLTYTCPPHRHACAPCCARNCSVLQRNLASRSSSSLQVFFLSSPYTDDFNLPHILYLTVPHRPTHPWRQRTWSTCMASQSATANLLCSASKHTVAVLHVPILYVLPSWILVGQLLLQHRYGPAPTNADSMVNHLLNIA